MNRKAGILLDNRLFRHAIARPSAENPERLRSLYHLLESPAWQVRFNRIAARMADQEAVEAVHSRFYLDQVRKHARSANPFSYDKDTYLMPDSLDCAFLAAGGCLQMADAIMSGVIDRGFALVRPPGHHAESGRGMGFCVLNNVAIVAAWLRRLYGLSRILVFDFDVHHGNGTQEVFYANSDVLVCSFHQKDLFPYSGDAAQVGEGRGLGYNVNVPVYSQYGDIEYLYLTGQVLQALVEQYMPQIIIVSAGFDGHKDDPISKTQLTSRWFGAVTTMLRQLTMETCKGRLLMVLEGGYNPDSLRESVLTVLDAMAQDNCRRVGIQYSRRASRLLDNHPAKQFWTF